MTEGNEQSIFIRKVLIAAGIVSLFVVVLLIFYYGFSALLLILAGVLFATYFRGLSYILADKTKLNDAWALVLVVVGTLIILAGVTWLLGAKIQQQTTQLSQTLPQKVESLKQQVSQYEWGQQLLDKAKKMGGNNTGSILRKVRSFFKTTFGVLGDIYVALFIGIFFTAGPQTYVDGFIKLIPPNHRQRGREVVNKLGKTLRSWLIGKILAMIVVAILTYIGLSIIGVPLALTLALIAGLLNFIPNFGPIIAMVPAALMGLSKGTDTALIIVALYVGIQIIESNLITPLIQKKLVQIPPALIIIGQLVMGVLVGGWGIVLATPVVLIIMVLTQQLYIKDGLGDDSVSIN